MFIILCGPIFNFLILVQTFRLVSLMSGFQLYGASIPMKCFQDLGQVLLFLAQYSVLLFAFFYFSVLFSGDPEIIALSEILCVNSCVWEIQHGYAELIFRHLLTNPIPGTSTVHLHYASRRHYEFTDKAR